MQMCMLQFLLFLCVGMYVGKDGCAHSGSMGTIQWSCRILFASCIYLTCQKKTKNRNITQCKCVCYSFLCTSFPVHSTVQCIYRATANCDILYIFILGFCETGYSDDLGMCTLILMKNPCINYWFTTTVATCSYKISYTRKLAVDENTVIARKLAKL